MIIQVTHPLYESGHGGLSWQYDKTKDKYDWITRTYFLDGRPEGYWKEGKIWDDFNYDQLVKNGKIGFLGIIQ